MWLKQLESISAEARRSGEKKVFYNKLINHVLPILSE